MVIIMNVKGKWCVTLLNNGWNGCVCCSFQMLFLSFDTDRSGKMSSYELRIALKAAGETHAHFYNHRLVDIRTSPLSSVGIHRFIVHFCEVLIDTNVS